VQSEKISAQSREKKIADDIGAEIEMVNYLLVLLQSESDSSSESELSDKENLVLNAVAIQRVKRIRILKYDGGNRKSLLRKGIHSLFSFEQKIEILYHNRFGKSI